MGLIDIKVIEYFALGREPFFIHDLYKQQLKVHRQPEPVIPDDPERVSDVAELAAQF